MAISKRNIAPTLLAVLLVTGCTQTISNTTFEVNSVNLTDFFRTKIVNSLYSKALELGGQCKLVNTERDLHRCQISEQNPSVSLTAGFNTQGSYTLSISSTYGHWIPPKREDVISGKFLGDIHIDLENWIKILIPSVAIVERERVYMGYE